MSIFFDFDVGSTGRRFRRAIDGDKDDINSINNHTYTDRLFGIVDIGSLIELSPLSICMIDEKKEVLGFMSLSDYPNIPGVDPSDWEVWIRNMFQKYCLSRNTLFIHYMCCIDEVSAYFLEEAIKTVFQNDVYLLNMIIVVPPKCPERCFNRYSGCRKYLNKCLPKREDNCENGLYLYIALRRDFCPKINIRKAAEEDNDDIVEILSASTSRLQELYGDFYISEIIGRHPEVNRKVIVADDYERVVGAMCLNSDINYSILQKTYELETYHGLQKATPLEKESNKRGNDALETFGEPIMIGKWSPFGDNVFRKREDANARAKYIKNQRKKSSKVNFNRNSVLRRSVSQIYYKHESDEYSEELYSSPMRSYTDLHTQSVVDYLLEDDPFDYEIVNIDNTLLAVPQALSFDFLLPRTPRDHNEGSPPFIFHNKFKKRISSSFKIRKTEEDVVIKYSGGPNAFMIELFGTRDDISGTYGFELLQEAFEIMSNYDYCVIRVPCGDKSFHLLQHFCFVPTKNNITSEYALYIAHRRSVISKLRVRRVETIDIPQVAQLMQSLDGRQTTWTIESTIMRKDELKCYVFLSGVSIVGIGILEPPEQIDFIRAKFNMETLRIHKYHLDEGHNGFVTLKAVLAYSAFEPHFRFFARELMRLSGNTCLLWLTAYRNKWITHKSNSLVSAMIPLLPRKMKMDPKPPPELRRIQKISNSIMSFSTWFISKKITSVPKVNVDARILVVGASRTAMAFLNSLIFGDSSSYLTFTNVTLVSPDGLPYTRNSKSLAEMMFRKQRTSTEKYLKSTPYTYYVNVIHGTMVELNKRRKYIELTNGCRCYYDKLFLLLGKQFQHPDYMKGIINKEKTSNSSDTPIYRRLDVPHDEPEPVTYGDTPDNGFIINTINDANKALNFINTIDWDHEDYKVIVYGADHHAYCCIATLMEAKVPCENIVFVEPFPDENIRKTRVSVFCNEYVDKSIQEVLTNLRIQVYHSYYFQSWSTEFNMITYVEFLSQSRLLRLKCAAFFFYGIQGVNEQAFIAMNKSGMVYDGGILIDHQFRTKDPSIYAAGPITRYHRQYYAETNRQKYYDSYELGTKLGHQIRNELDPLFTEKEKILKRPIKRSVKNVSFDSTLTSSDVSERTSKQEPTAVRREVREKESENIFRLPEFKSPITTHCMLPGGLQYLDVQPPGKKTPHHYVQSLNYNGFVLETFTRGYFKLHLTNNLIVDGITCLSSDSYPLENFKNLYGLSSVVLNNVFLRYATKKLDNLYEFFQSPWAYFLYQDQTDELFAMVKELKPKGQRHGETLSEALRAVGRTVKATNKQCNNLQTMLKIRSNFEKSPHIEAITNYVIEWLSENDALMPMYLQPSQSGNFVNTDNNPAFMKRKRSIVNMLSKIL